MTGENENLGRIAYVSMLIIFISFGIISFAKSSEWVLDNILSILTLSLLFIKRDYLKLTLPGFLAVGTALLFHNIGMFGLYGLNWKYFAYDNFIHFISSFIGAFVVFNMINEKTNKRLFQKDRFILAIIVISIVTLIGVAIEIAEYAGGIIYGEGEGLFMTGDGDTDSIVIMNREIYDDTLNDLAVNLIGSVLGTIMAFWKNQRPQA